MQKDALALTNLHDQQYKLYRTATVAAAVAGQAAAAAVTVAATALTAAAAATAASVTAGIPDTSNYIAK